MKTTKEEREYWRSILGAFDKSEDMYICGTLIAADVFRLLDDADRCAELEKKNNALLKRLAERQYPPNMRSKKLEAVLRAVDAALENEFGGFYLSAPEDEPLGCIREMLRGEE